MEVAVVVEEEGCSQRPSVAAGAFASEYPSSPSSPSVLFLYRLHSSSPADFHSN
jgi:hypothetical protein